MMSPNKARKHLAHVGRGRGLAVDVPAPADDIVGKVALRLACEREGLSVSDSA